MTHRILFAIAGVLLVASLVLTYGAKRERMGADKVRAEWTASALKDAERSKKLAEEVKAQADAERNAQKREQERREQEQYERQAKIIEAFHIQLTALQRKREKAIATDKACAAQMMEPLLCPVK